jgi:hypothetical protein
MSITSHSDNTIFDYNYSLIANDLTGKNIIYKTQYIFDDDTQIDGDGPQSDWQQTLLCIEKTDDDYIYHIYNSNFFHAYSYAYLSKVTKFYPCMIKFSKIQTDFINISEKSTSDIGNFIKFFNDQICHGFHSGDEFLISELKILYSKIEDLEIILEDKITKEREEREKQEIEYKKSDAYQKSLIEEFAYKEIRDEEYRLKEEERLKRCIEAYGEEKGRLFWQRL